MTFAEFKIRVHNKLFITNADALQFDYEQKIIPTLNEALVLIANTTSFTRKAVDIVVLDSDLPLTYTLPTDCVSVVYISNIDEDGEDPSYFQPSRSQIKFLTSGTFIIEYNSYFPNLTESLDDMVELDIDTSVLTAAVFYVAAELMRDVNLPEATIMQNEFEIWLARINDRLVNKQGSFKINSRW